MQTIIKEMKMSLEQGHFSLMAEDGIRWIEVHIISIIFDRKMIAKTMMSGQIAIFSVRRKRINRMSFDVCASSFWTRSMTRMTVPITPSVPKSAALVIDETVDVVTVEIIKPQEREKSNCSTHPLIVCAEYGYYMDIQTDNQGSPNIHGSFMRKNSIPAAEFEELISTIRNTD
jgi:hypothetical protein